MISSQNGILLNSFRIFDGGIIKPDLVVGPGSIRIAFVLGNYLQDDQQEDNKEYRERPYTQQDLIACF